MDEKFWEKIYSLQENGEFEKIIKEIRGDTGDRGEQRYLFQVRHFRIRLFLRKYRSISSNAV